jgi:hypothetical protein
MPTAITLERVTPPVRLSEPALWLLVRLSNGEKNPIYPTSIQASVQLKALDKERDLGNISFLIPAHQLLAQNNTINPNLYLDFQGYVRLDWRALELAEMGDARHDLALLVSLHAGVLVNNGSGGWNPHNVGSNSIEREIRRAEWTEWTKRWGRDAESIFLTGPAARRLGELRRALQHSNDNELMVELLGTYDQAKAAAAAPIDVVRTTPTECSIKTALGNLLKEASTAGGRLNIMAPHLDATQRMAIADARRGGAEVRLLVRDPEDLRQNRKGVLEALALFRKDGVAIRIHPMVHARVTLSQCSVLLGSADLNSVSLDSNRELGIITQNPRLRLAAEKFFEDVWSEAKDWTGIP